MAANKTTETAQSVTDFINSVTDEKKRTDCFELINILQQQLKLEPKMWGPSIVGFGSYHYKYASGREGDSPNFAFSPRASSIALYFSANFENREALLAEFGKYKSDKGCIHIKSLANIDKNILAVMVDNHVKHIAALYPTA
ncbi:MAG: DUF1801 domain-containing protein [Chitinophagaceae bacterium]